MSQTAKSRSNGDEGVLNTLRSALASTSTLLPKKLFKPTSKPTIALNDDGTARRIGQQMLAQALQAERELLKTIDNSDDDDDCDDDTILRNIYTLHGHKLLILQLDSPSFCDVCSRLIWGIYRLSLKCKCKSNAGVVFVLIFLALENEF